MFSPSPRKSQLPVPLALGVRTLATLAAAYQVVLLSIGHATLPKLVWSFLVDGRGFLYLGWVLVTAALLWAVLARVAFSRADAWWAVGSVCGVPLHFALFA